MDDFTMVTYKKKKYYKDNFKCILKKELVIQQIFEIINPYNPYAVYLYGSTAREKNNENSDVDIFVIWKKIPNNIIINEIHNKLYRAFNRKVDFVNYQYNGRSIKIDYTSKCFIQNVISDAVSIIEQDNKGIAIKEIHFDFDDGFDLVYT